MNKAPCRCKLNGYPSFGICPHGHMTVMVTEEPLEDGSIPTEEYAPPCCPNCPSEGLLNTYRAHPQGEMGTSSSIPSWPVGDTGWIPTRCSSPGCKNSVTYKHDQEGLHHYSTCRQHRQDGEEPLLIPGTAGVGRRGPSPTPTIPNEHRASQGPLPRLRCNGCGKVREGLQQINGGGVATGFFCSCGGKFTPEEVTV